MTKKYSIYLTLLGLTMFLIGALINQHASNQWAVSGNPGIGGFGLIFYDALIIPSYLLGIIQFILGLFGLITHRLMKTTMIIMLILDFLAVIGIGLFFLL